MMSLLYSTEQEQHTEPTTAAATTTTTATPSSTNTSFIYGIVGKQLVIKQTPLNYRFIITLPLISEYQRSPVVASALNLPNFNTSLAAVATYMHTHPLWLKGKLNVECVARLQYSMASLTRK